MMEYITANWPALLAALVAGVALLKAISVLTPSKMDDAIVAKLESLEKLVEAYGSKYQPTEDLSKAPTEVISVIKKANP